MRDDHYTMVARNAVRKALSEIGKNDSIAIGVSGGADSLALMIAVSTLYKKDRAKLVHIVNIDHQLQAVTSQVALAVKELSERFGFTYHGIKIIVPDSPEGMEAAARAERYSAFEKIIKIYNIKKFLIGHTMGDQAEQVLLGLLRGSGSKSISGMPQERDHYSRPFLFDLTRENTVTVCEENGVSYWSDPQNDSTEYNRVNIRKLLRSIEKDTGFGIVKQLSRTAKIVREDDDSLSFYTEQAYRSFVDSDYSIRSLSKVPTAVRKRVFHKILKELGLRNKTTSLKLEEIDRLVSDWSGQGPVIISDECSVSRVGKRIVFDIYEK